MQTKFEIFCAYLPYNVSCITTAKHIFTFGALNTSVLFYDGVQLILRPLTLLNTPMKHPVTGEEIENPAEWIADKVWNKTYMGEDVFNALLGNSAFVDVTTNETRQIDRLALSLHFDIYGAIERGFAIEVQP